MPTIKDIAKAAGVSHGTVSNVLNKRSGVSYEKIRLVEKTAIAMGYALDEQASMLRRGKSRTVVALLPNVLEQRYGDLYTGMLNCAKAGGFDLRLMLTDDLPHAELSAVREAASMKACAVLCVSCISGHRKAYAPLLSRKTPLLFLERAPDDPSLCAYTFDMKQAALQAYAHVPDPAAACVLTGEAHFSDQAVFRAQLPMPAGAFYDAARPGGGEAVHQLINCGQPPRSVICTSDALARQLLGAWQQSREDALRVIALSSLRPSPSQAYACVNLNYRLMAHQATLALMQEVRGEERARSRVFPVYGTSVPFSGHSLPRPGKLRVLVHKTPSTQALEQLLPRFERKTGIAVEMVSCTLDELHRRLHQGGLEAFDAVRLDPSMLPYLAPRHLQPLCGIDPQAATAQERFLPGLEEDYASVGGTLYALPFDISVQMLFYQRSLLEDAGQQRDYLERTQRALDVPGTYEAFDTLCRFFTRASRSESPSQYGASFPPSNPTSVASDYLPRLLAAGGLVYDSRGRLDLSTPQALATVQAYVAYAACSSRQPSHSWSDIAAGFVRGDVAMSILYAHHAANFVLARHANAGVDIGCAPIPGGRPLLAGGSLAVTRYTQRPQEAYDFIAWATGEDMAPEMVMLGGTSACAKVYEHRDILDTFPWLEALPEQMRIGIRKPILSADGLDYNQRDFEYALGKNLLAAVCGLKTPQEALEETARFLSGIEQPG